MVMIFIVVIIMLFIIVLFVMVFNLINPCRRCSDLVEIEHVSVQQLVEIDIAIVALYYLGLGLKCSDNAMYTAQFVGRDFGSLVEQNDIAEFNLLDDKILYIIFIQIGSQQVITSGKLVLHTQCVDNSDDTVDYRNPVAYILCTHCRYRTDCLSNRCRLAYSAGFNDYIVEAVLADHITQLFDQIHLQSTADAAVLQCHKVVVLFTHYATFFDEVGIDVDFSYIVDNDGKLNAATVIENSVE